MLVFLRDEGLLHLRACETIETYCRRCWPGEAVSTAQLLKYLLVAERAPEGAVVAGRAGIELHGAIARIDQPACRDVLYGQLLGDRPLEAIWRGARAAREAQGLPEAMVTAQVGEAIAGRRQRRARKGTERRIEQDAQRLCLGVSQLLKEAEPVGMSGEVRERLLGALQQVEGVPEAERRRTERDPDRAEQAQEAEPAKVPLEPEPAPAAAAPGAPAPAPPGLPPPAKKPPRRTPYQQHLPVSYPYEDYAASQAELHAARAIVAMEQSNRIADEVFVRTRHKGDGIATILMLHYQHAYAPFREVRVAVEARIKDHAEAGRAAREKRLAEEPGLSPEALWPIRTRPEEVSLPWTWLTLDVIDPFCDPAPTEAEQKLFWVLALLRAAEGELERFLFRLDEGDEVAEDVYHQLAVACDAANTAPRRLCILFHEGATEARREEEARAPEREAERLRLELADANLVVLGEGCVPEHYVKVAEAADGSHVAISLHTGQILVVLGAQGMGKSHLGVLLLEGLLLSLPGLNRLGIPGSAVVFAGDWRKGHTRHQHLRGFYPNPHLLQWDHLRRTYGVAFGMSNAAYGRAILACLPGTAARYRAMYPDLLERGLEVREVRLHPREWSNFGYHLFLGCADQIKGRTQAQVFLSNLIAQLGPDAHIDRIQREFERSGLGGASRPVLQGAFSLIRGLTSTEERVADLVAEPGTPVLCYLESEAMGPEQILSIQLGMMTALNRPLPGDLFLLYILEEVAKQGVSPELMAAFAEMAREVRHNRRSAYFGAHLPTDLPVEVVSMASGIFQFGGTSPQALRRLQEISGLLPGLQLKDVMQLGPGRAYGGFQRASSGLYVRQPQLLQFRPSCIDAGGETMTR